MLAFGMFFLLTLHTLYTKCKQEEHSYIAISRVRMFLRASDDAHCILNDEVLMLFTNLLHDSIVTNVNF